MPNYLIISNQAYPRWKSSFTATLSWADTKLDGKNWGHAFEHKYKHCHALITDLAPAWPDLTDDVLPIRYDGLQAVSVARLRSLPAFVYTPYSPEGLVSACYRAGCLAVVSSAIHNVEALENIIAECTRTDSLWIDRDNHSKAFYNHLLCASDESLGRLTDQDIAIFLNVVSHRNYEESAKSCKYTVGTIRNKSSAIFKQCGFKNRSQALTHALKIGLTGIV